MCSGRGKRVVRPSILVVLGHRRRCDSERRIDRAKCEILVLAGLVTLVPGTFRVLAGAGGRPDADAGLARGPGRLATPSETRDLCRHLLAGARAGPPFPLLSEKSGPSGHRSSRMGNFVVVGQAP